MRTLLTAKNFIVSIVLRVITIALGLVITPILLRHLGSDDFGAYRATLDWFSYLTLLEFGFEGALIGVLAASDTQPSKSELRNQLAASLKIFAFISVLKFAGAWVLVFFIGDLISYPDDPQVLFFGTALAAFSMVLTAVTPFRTLIRVRQKGYILSTLLIIQTIATSLLAVSLVVVGYGLDGMFIALFLGNLIAYLPVIYWAGPEARGACWHLIANFRNVSVPRVFFRQNRANFIVDTTNRVTFASDTMIAAFFLGPAAIVPLIMTQRLPQLCQNLLQELGNASWASLVNLRSEGHEDLFKQRMCQMTKLIAAFGASGGAPLLAANVDFVSLWVGHENFGGPLLNAVVVVNAFVIGILSLWRWCFIGVGRTGAITRISLVNLIINIAISIVLTPSLGVAGPVVGTLLSALATSAWALPMILERELGVSAQRLVVSVLQPVAVTMVPGAGVYFIGRMMDLSHWFMLIPFLSLSALALLACNGLILTTREERTATWARITQALGRQ